MAKPQAEAHRFLFDHSFDAPKKAAKKPKPEDEKPPEPTFGSAQMEAARQESYEQGRLAGAAEAASGAEAETARLVAEIAARLPGIDAAQAEANGGLMRDGAALAAAIVRKILPGYIARNGLDEIDTLLEQCLRTLIDEPKIVVRVSAQHAGEVSARLGAAAAAGRFAGRFMVEGDGDMGPSDCHVSWQGGGLERKADEIWRQADGAVEAYLATRPAAASGNTDESPVAGANPDETGTPDEALETSEER
jgi:flagellar assembly protein FliH